MVSKTYLAIIAVLLLFGGYFGFKFSLQRLIVDNYVMRMKGLAKDELYWADALYMKFYWPQDRHSYTGMYVEALNNIGVVD